MSSLVDCFTQSMPDEFISCIAHTAKTFNPDQFSYVEKGEPR
jgi:hypothetical protein